MRRWEDVKMKMRRCEDVRKSREDVKRRRCEDEKMWRWEDVRMRRCEDEKMWGWEDEVQTPTIGRTLRSDALGKKQWHFTCKNTNIYIYIYTNIYHNKIEPHSKLKPYGCLLPGGNTLSEHLAAMTKEFNRWCSSMKIRQDHVKEMMVFQVEVLPKHIFITPHNYK
jgi:hypothetical protein